MYLYISVVLGLADSEVVQVLSKVGRPAVLACPHASQSAIYVKWKDLIYNTGRDPEMIFDSTSNPSMAINENHKDKNNLRVEANYNLRILNVSMVHYGEFKCEVKVDVNHTIESTIKLNVMGKSFYQTECHE